ncbi:MAG: hypothetical protein PWP43_203 [Bacillota bacterium]|nr:hypothetical protein [Bacillota bacterium]
MGATKGFAAGDMSAGTLRVYGYGKWNRKETAKIISEEDKGCGS